MKEKKSEKGKLREHMQTLRAALSPAEVESKSKAIHVLLYSSDFYSNANRIMTYISFRNEVDTIGIIQRSLMEGKEVVVPICIPDTCELLPSRILSLDELSASHFGIMEPKEPFIRPINPKDIDLVIVPGLAFDKQRNRLGFGKGYYDRFLSNLPPDALKVAIAYQFQVLDSIPVEVWDLPMDLIITEQGII